MPRRYLGSTLVALSLLISACGGTVDVEPPDPPTPVAQDMCADLATQLPERVVGEGSRPTDPESVSTAAWGEPAIVLRCGVGKPQALMPSSQLIDVNGLEWFAEELTQGYIFTTYDLAANVEVTVPDDYAPEIGPVTELSTPVQAAIAQSS